MNISKLLYIAGIIFLLTSCSTSEKISVNTSEGTKIYTPYNNLTPAAIADNTGKVNLEIPSDMYCGYVLAQSADSDVKVPIGLDYKKNSHTGTKVALYSGYTLASIGAGAAILGAVCMILASSQKDEDNTDLFGLVAGVGGGVAGIGAGIGMPSQSRLRQTSYDYNFGYVNNQTVKIPTLSKTLLHPNPAKGYENEVSKKNQSTGSRKKASSGTNINSKSQQTSTNSSKINKARSDYAKRIEGKYVGNGKLLYGKTVDEVYSQIYVLIERIDKNHVSVRIIESDEDYFESPLIYVIKKGKNGRYNLVIDKLPGAVIRISSNGKLTFNHNKVNIEDKQYTLVIEADKSK